MAKFRFLTQSCGVIENNSLRVKESISEFSIQFFVCINYLVISYIVFALVFQLLR